MKSVNCSLSTKRIIKQIWDNISDRQWRDWHWQIENRITDVSRIADLLNLLPKQRAALKAVTGYYPFCVTPYYLSLCKPKDARDPIMCQFLPDRRELTDRNTLRDPLSEEKYSPVPCLIHRYPNRVVVIVTSECAVRCRHCTRKNSLPFFARKLCGPACNLATADSPPRRTGRLPQGGMAFLASQGSAKIQPSQPEALLRRSRLPRGLSRGASPGFGENDIETNLPQIVKYIRRREKIREVIISGGDPLLLETPVLDRVMGELTAIKNVEVLRLGTRAPVVLPMRIDAELCACLAKHRPIWINTQFNHPREITPEAEQACRLLQEAGLPVSNQAVLLRGVNDSLAVLAKLFNKLQHIMVRPYYVFQCDRVRGVKHFITRKSEGAKLSERLRSRLGGLSMPLFVADVPGRKSKVPLETVCCLPGKQS